MRELPKGAARPTIMRVLLLVLVLVLVLVLWVI
jgi:hypothetical protein